MPFSSFFPAIFGTWQAPKRAREDPGLGRITLNVGGTRFETSLATLTANSSYFSRRFASDWSDALDNERELFVDLDPDSFKILLSCMRQRMPLLPTEAELFSRVLLDAEFLGVDWLIDEVKERTQKHLHTEAALFDTEHGDLRAALLNGILPDRFFGPPPVPPPKTRIVQLIPPPEKTYCTFNGTEENLTPLTYGEPGATSVKLRVAHFALLEDADGTRHTEPIVEHGDWLAQAYASNDAAVHQLDLASEVARHYGIQKMGLGHSVNPSTVNPSLGDVIVGPTVPVGSPCDG